MSAVSQVDALSKLQEELERVQKINAVLMDRVERSMDMQGSAFSLFQTATLLEQQVRDRTQELQDALAKLETSNADLVRAKDEADAANRAKSDFLAKMSHEIRTPMNGVLGMTEVLLGTQLGDRQLRLVNTIRSSADSLLGIINSILDFSKIEAGGVQLEHIEFDLLETIEETARLLAEGAQSKGLDLVCDLPWGQPSLVTGDPLRLRQILTNLAGNAIKFTESGEVVIRVRYESIDPDAVLCRFEVKDGGIGLRSAELERIFDSFRQADDSTTRRFGGSGLGLTIARQLVELMNGRIGVVSELDHGSCFWFELPLCRTETSALGLSSSELSFEGRRALVVAPPSSAVDARVAQLRALGLGVDRADDTGQALNRMRSAAKQGSAYDIAVAERGSGAQDGIKLLRSMRQLPRLQDTPLIIVTKVGDPGRDAQEDELDGLYYVSKPPLLRTLRDALADAFGLLPSEQGEEERRSDLSGPVRFARVSSVLVVEDNTINQDVIVEMLDGTNCDITIASNGIEALEQLEAKSFEIVFMDCHMPEMDGYDATAEIRRREENGEWSARVPIIALTANAMVGDRERCLESGMDDFLSKPFSRSELNEVLRRWLGGEAEAVSERSRTDGTEEDERLVDSVASTLQSVVQEVEDSPLDPAALDRLRDMQRPGRSDLIGRLAQQFVGDAPGRLQEVLSALESGDAHALELAAHTLKSDAANLGARALASILQELENAGRIGKPGAARPLRVGLHDQFSKALTAIQSLRHPAPKPRRQPSRG